jgi:hypothetical protein
MRSSTTQRHRRPLVSVKKERTSLTGADDAIGRPILDLAFFLKEASPGANHCRANADRLATLLAFLGH